jgi:hypothetical protein
MGFFFHLRLRNSRRTDRTRDIVDENSRTVSNVADANGTDFHREKDSSETLLAVEALQVNELVLSRFGIVTTMSTGEYLRPCDAERVSGSF